ncbi:hypothetical protein BDC45DRAFT_318524 [Circinella umbellata]|nr:hypothetical protein BDC45DRAFT_318524 [Circinella umbellata]
MTEPANESKVNASNSSISIVAQDITTLSPHTSSFSSSSRKRSASSESNDSDSEENNNNRTRASSSEAEAIQPPPRSRPRIQTVSADTLYRQLESRFSNDNHYLDRLERAYTQPMSVVRVTIQGNNRRMFSVRGNTGTIYRVIIGRNMSCSCPDYVGHCKHLLMVLLKVFHTNANSEAYNTLKITTEGYCIFFSLCLGYIDDKGYH